MAGLLQKILGGSSSAPPAAPSVVDADFADFQSATAEPTPASLFASNAAVNPVQTAAYQTGHPLAARPYTAWYRVWERTSLSDFKQEAIIVPFILAIVLAHIWGTRVNRRKARTWINHVAPVLQSEFAQVGFTAPQGDEETVTALANTEHVLKERSLNEFSSFATGRQNVAFVDLKLTLLKRFNPFLLFGEAALGFFWESLPQTEEKMEVMLYPFDGHEKEVVPGSVGPKGSVSASQFDGFVWAIVHKEKMKGLRDERYDLSLTSTKDHPKLPAIFTVMTEAAEVTEALLTPELIKAVTDAGDSLEALIVTDQPVDAPKKLDELTSRKRLLLTLSNPTEPSTELLSAFFRLADHLPKVGHFRPEVTRRLTQTRDAQVAKIRRLDEEEKAGDRKTNLDKKKKEEREKLLKGMTADQQRKYLVKESEKERRKAEKKRTMRA